MFKHLHDKAWIFDAEWVPDPEAGKILYQLPEDLPDKEVINEMWIKGGATEEDPMPYLKTAICKVVSIAAVTRTVVAGEIKLHLLSLPKDSADLDQINESNIISTFLNAIGKHKPQLVGFNSHRSDMKILIQRGIANGFQAKDFCKRPDKPWEGIDYFAKGSDYNIDLMDIVGGWGKSAPSLNEMASVSGIPGKLDTDGNQVAALWLEGKIDQIVAYNEFDSITTYLLWLRIAHFGGFFSDSEYQEEQDLLLQLLKEESQKSERSHLTKYIDAWKRT